VVTYYQITAAVRVLGPWTFQTYGTWQATLYVERSEDGVNGWERIRRFSGKEDRNVSIEATQDDEAWLRVVVEDYVLESPASTTTPRAVLEASDATVYGLARVTAFTDSTHVTADVVRDMQSTDATELWSEGAWSDVRGYPCAVTLYEQRLCFAGSAYQPQTIWGSATGEFETFAGGTEDDDSFAYTVGATQRNSIQWLVAHRALLVGTSGGEWSVQAGSADQPLTPTNVLVRRQSNYGSASLPGRLVNEAVLFVQRQKLKIREMTYSFERDGYVAPDLTLLAEHITAGGIKQTAFQQQPQAVLWMVTNEGVLVGMTYERDQSVVGCHRHVTAGLFESVATVYGDGADEVWAVVKRTINGDEVRYVERLNPVAWTEKEDAFYVDSGLSYSGAAVGTFSGLDHLEGETVSILADGDVFPDQVVTGGELTLPDGATATVAHIGLPFTTIIQPMRLDVDPLAGASQGQVKQIREVVIRLNNSLGLTYGDGVRDYGLSFRATQDEMDSSPPLFTGDKVVEFDGDFDYDTPLIIQQTQPLPLCLLAIFVKYQITGN
jgi:hypothetical protein